MRCVTCLCGLRVEADDSAALDGAFLAHTDDQHGDLKVPDWRRQELVEAIRRSGGWDGERETIEGPIELRPLTPALKDEYIAYFDGPAFADNPVWAQCYCLSYHQDMPQSTIDSRRSEQNRADRAAQIERGEASGVMAFAGGRVVGWCNASPRASLPLLDRTPGFESDDPEHTGAIVCYVIAPRYRGQGIARRLLEGATDMLRVRGFRWLDAYPPKAAPTPAASYHGRLDMYVDAGFQRVREAGRHIVVRKALSEGGSYR